MSKPPLAIEHLPTAALRPYARNARTHSAKQIAQIAASIREFGFNNPVLGCQSAPNFDPGSACNIDPGFAFRRAGRDRSCGA